MRDRVILVNGDERRTTAATLRDLLDEMGYPAAPSGIAVAIGDRIVPRTAWSRQPLETGDRVEIVGAVQGG